MLPLADRAMVKHEEKWLGFVWFLGGSFLIFVIAVAIRKCFLT